MRTSTFFLFLLTVLLFSTTEVIASSGSYTHKHTPIELEPTSLENSYQTSAVCFLGTGDCGAGGFGKGDEDMDINPGEQCKNQGYDKTCPTGWHPEIGLSCPHDPSYIKCCKETCPENAATSCTGEAVGNDGCGYTCKKCCSTSCDARYNYTASQLTGSTGNGWVKDGEDFCDHCTKGKLYKRKATAVPPGYKTCGCGGSNPFISGGTTYYQSCNCCSSCSGSTSTSGMAYYNSCYNSCTGQTLYSSRSCNSLCKGSTRPSCSSGASIVTRSDECGNTCYGCQDCTEYKAYYTSCSFTGRCSFVAPSYGNSKGYYKSRCECYYDNPHSCSNVATSMSWEKGHNTESECLSYQSSSDCSARNRTVAATCSRCSTSWQY